MIRHQTAPNTHKEKGEKERKEKDKKRKSKETEQGRNKVCVGKHY
jgi:hypothetical protein